MEAMKLKFETISGTSKTWQLNEIQQRATTDAGDKQLNTSIRACEWTQRDRSRSGRVAWVEAYLHAKFHIDPFNQTYGPKIGGDCAPLGSWVPTLLLLLLLLRG